MNPAQIPPGKDAAKAKKTVLLVDDEELFLRTCVDGFAAAEAPLRVLTAHDGRAAVQVLAREAVDLVVTDLHMPEMDGFALLAYMSRACPQVPTIVMTAFGTAAIESQLAREGVACCLDKPLDFPVLARAILDALSDGARGHVQGIALATFLQMIEADRKTCGVRVTRGGERGTLFFHRGELIDAECGAQAGWDAALALASWEAPAIELLTERPRRERRITGSLTELLLESARQRDEDGRGAPPAPRPPPPRAPAGSDFSSGASGTASAGASGTASTGAPSTLTNVAPEPGGDEPRSPQEDHMGASDKLKELATVEGFAGAGLYTPAGEPLATVAGDNHRLKEIGVLANSLLLNAQRASLEMGAGAAFEVQIDAEKADIIAHCLNEGTDPMKTVPGKAHIHLVVVLKNDENIGMARLRMRSVIEKLAPDFR